MDKILNEKVESGKKKKYSTVKDEVEEWTQKGKGETEWIQI